MNRFNYCRLLYSLLALASLAACNSVNSDTEEVSETLDKNKHDSVTREQENKNADKLTQITANLVNIKNRRTTKILEDEGSNHNPRKKHLQKKRTRKNTNTSNVHLDEGTVISSMHFDGNTFSIKSYSGVRVLLDGNIPVAQEDKEGEIHYTKGSMKISVPKNSTKLKINGGQMVISNQGGGRGTSFQNVSFSQVTRAKREKPRSRRKPVISFTLNSNKFSVTSINGKRALLNGNDMVAQEDENGEINYTKGSMKISVAKNSTEVTINEGDISVQDISF